MSKVVPENTDFNLLKVHWPLKSMGAFQNLERFKHKVVRIVSKIPSAQSVTGRRAAIRLIKITALPG